MKQKQGFFIVGGAALGLIASILFKRDIGLGLVAGAALGLILSSWPPV